MPRAISLGILAMTRPTAGAASAFVHNDFNDAMLCDECTPRARDKRCKGAAAGSAGAHGYYAATPLRRYAATGAGRYFTGKIEFRSKQSDMRC